MTEIINCPITSNFRVTIPDCLLDLATLKLHCKKSNLLGLYYKILNETNHSYAHCSRGKSR